LGVFAALRHRHLHLQLRLLVKVRDPFTRLIGILLRLIALFFLYIVFTLFIIFLFRSILSTHNIHWKIEVTSLIKIDAFGALIPTAISIFFVLFLTHVLNFAFKRYLGYFMPSILLAFLLTQVTSSGIYTDVFLFIDIVGFLAAFISFYEGRLEKFLWVMFMSFYRRRFSKLKKSHDLYRFHFTRRNYITAVLVGTSYASLSVFIADLSYLTYIMTHPATGHSTLSMVYIGASGLIDGISVSGILAPFVITYASLFMWSFYKQRRKG